MTPPDSRDADDLREFLLFVRALLLALVAYIEKKYGLKRKS